MTGMHMISCIRFSLQLLITESIYTFGLKRKKYFFWRILLGIVLYFGLALTTFYLLAGIPSENPSFTGSYADWAQTLIYLCEMTFTIAMPVGSVKGAQTLTSKAFGL